MALIFRCIVEVDSPDLMNHAPGLFSEWAGRKLRAADFELPPDGEAHAVADGCEASAVSCVADDKTAFRGYLYEKRPREEVKTTFTALAGDGGAWAWIDLERWAEDAWEGSWVPYSPGIVHFVLRRFKCGRGPSGLDNQYRTLAGEQGALLAAQVLEADRVVPIVVASPAKGELEGDMKPAHDRAHELQRRLAGVAPVYLLSTGAVSAFSKEMLRAGEEMDVHSGSVRTYLPGAGSVRDMPWRHRYVPFSRLVRRPSDMAARLVALPLMRAASHQAPPTLWRTFRELPEFRGGERDSDLVDLVDLAEGEAKELREQISAADNRAQEAEAGLDREREAQAELLAEREDLVRRLRYAEAQLRNRGEAPAPAGVPAEFEPDFCEDLVEHTEAQFGSIELGPAVIEGARELDEHAEPAWAKKALRALDALNAYAEAKKEGFSGNFRTFCESGELSVVPTSWVALQESESTDQNPRFRALRTFDVPETVDATGSIYMPAHIKIEQGGNPSPRLHFHDDTEGATGKIHVGWLGPHLDNKSKT